MSRYKGDVNLSFIIERQKAAPLDATMLVDYYSDLTDSATWGSSNGENYTYIGMQTTVSRDDEDKNGVYILVAQPYTDSKNWKKLTFRDELLDLSYIILE